MKYFKILQLGLIVAVKDKIYHYSQLSFVLHGHSNRYNSPKISVKRSRLKRYVVIIIIIFIMESKQGKTVRSSAREVIVNIINVCDLEAKNNSINIPKVIFYN